MSWAITLTDEQIHVVKDALEEYFRIRLGQFREITDSIAFSDCDTNDKIKWKECFARREAALVLMESAFRLMRPEISLKKTENMLIAEDIWGAVKHALWLNLPQERREQTRWCVDADAPLNLSGQPLPKIKQEVIRSAAD